MSLVLALWLFLGPSHKCQGRRFSVSVVVTALAGPAEQLPESLSDRSPAPTVSGGSWVVETIRASRPSRPCLEASWSLLASSCPPASHSTSLFCILTKGNPIPPPAHSNFNTFPACCNQWYHFIFAPSQSATPGRGSPGPYLAGLIDKQGVVESLNSVDTKYTDNKPFT